MTVEFGDLRLPVRFWKKLQVDPITGCWNWTASSYEGYGRFWWKGKLRKPHRVAYDELVSPIPADLEPDHLCRNHSCCNPNADHIEPVTHAENVRRGAIGKITAARQRAKTHCPHGHPYDEANTYISPQGHRGCRTCVRERALVRYHNQRRAAA